MNANWKEIHELINRANQFKNDLMSAGLLRTFHKMDEVTKEIGWEVSDIMDDNHPAKLEVEES